MPTNANAGRVRGQSQGAILSRRKCCRRLRQGQTGGGARPSPAASNKARAAGSARPLNTHTHTHTHIHPPHTYLHTPTHTYTHTRTHTRTHSHAQRCTCTYVHTYIRGQTTNGLPQTRPVGTGSFVPYQTVSKRPSDRTFGGMSSRADEPRVKVCGGMEWVYRLGLEHIHARNNRHNNNNNNNNPPHTHAHRSGL